MDGPIIKLKATGPFRLLDLPNELILVIFKQAPSLHTARLLRLGCRLLNQIYKANEDSIESAQVDNLVSVIGGYYKYLTTLHLDPEQFHVPGEEFKWDITMPGASAFTEQVLRALPRFETEDGSTCALDEGVEYFDWASDDESLKEMLYGERHELHVRCGVPIGDIVPLTWLEHWKLDTQKAEIWDGLAYRSCDVREFFAKKRRLFKWCNLILVPGHSIAIRPHLGEANWKELDGDRVEMLSAIFSKYGWPDNFDRAGVEEINSFIEWTFKDSVIPREW